MQAMGQPRLVRRPQRLFRGEDLTMDPLREVLLLDDVVPGRHELVDEILNAIESGEDLGGVG